MLPQYKETIFQQHRFRSVVRRHQKVEHVMADSRSIVKNNYIHFEYTLDGMYEPMKVDSLVNYHSSIYQAINVFDANFQSYSFGRPVEGKFSFDDNMYYLPEAIFFLHKENLEKVDELEKEMLDSTPGIFSVDDATIPNRCEFMVIRQYELLLYELQRVGGNYFYETVPCERISEVWLRSR
jgi:hypothetical protein